MQRTLSALLLTGLVTHVSFAQGILGDPTSGSGNGAPEEFTVEFGDVKVKPNDGDEASFSIMTIGVSQYSNLPNLRFTAHDAKRVSKAFLEVGKLPKQNVKTLVDGNGSETSKVQSKLVRDELQAFLHSRKKESTTIVYFSGHGYRQGNSLYLVSEDFDPKRPEETGVSIDELRQLLIDSPAENKIVILDCCFAGAFGEANRISGDTLAGSFRVVPGCVALTASSGKQLSGEVPEAKAGIFTYWLADGLRGRANKNFDEWIDMAEIFKFVSAKVKKSTAGRQTPSMSFDQSQDIPNVISLKNPDRPSDMVGIIPFPTSVSGNLRATLLDTYSQFPTSNPRVIIGTCHWILKDADPGEKVAQQARELIKKVDKLVLQGKAILGPPHPTERPR